MRRRRKKKRSIFEKTQHQSLLEEEEEKKEEDLFTRFSICRCYEKRTTRHHAAPARKRQGEGEGKEDLFNKLSISCEKRTMRHRAAPEN
jgi:hypothetical protein